jgi:hypothetical protein
VAGHPQSHTIRFNMTLTAIEAGTRLLSERHLPGRQARLLANTG